MSTGVTQLPTTTRAKLKLPPNSVDCHGHVYGPFTKYPLRGRETSEQTYEAYVKMHELTGFDRGVLTQPSHYQTDNACMIDALERSKGSIKGIIAIDLKDLNEKEVSRLDALGVRGIRVGRRVAAGLKLDELEAAADRIKGVGWHFEMGRHEGMNWDEMRPRMEKLAVPILVEGFGGPKLEAGVNEKSFQGLLGMLRDNVCWVKLSHPYQTSPYPYKEMATFAQAIVDANPGRAVFGLDWPHPGQQEKSATPDDGFLTDLLSDWIPDEAKRKRVLVDNPAEIHRF